MQIVAALKSLDANVSRYNQMAHRLKLVPATAKRADGVTYELHLNREAATLPEFANVDLKVRGCCQSWAQNEFGQSALVLDTVTSAI